MCRLFMDMIDDPFRSIDKILNYFRKNFEDSIKIVDIHGESTSEKMAIAHYLDGRASAVVGIILIFQLLMLIFLKKNILPNRPRHVWRL